MYKEITADDKRTIRDAVYARLEEEDLAIGDDQNKRLIASGIIYMLGATDEEKSKLTTGTGHDWYMPLDDFPDGFTDLHPHPDKPPIPSDYMLVTTIYFEEKSVYQPGRMGVHERRQMRAVVEVLGELFPNWVDASRAEEVIKELNRRGY